MAGTPITHEPDEATIAGLLRAEIADHRRVLEATARSIERSFQASLQVMEASLRASGKLLIFGNGGSAAEAQHLAAELVVRYRADRPAIAAVALTTDSSILTACSNDLGFDTIFARQIEALGRTGDVALGISTSGRSPNVISGLYAARKRGLVAVGLSGEGGTGMDAACDVLMRVPSRVTARIQEMHTMIGHMLCKALERRLYPGGSE